MNKPPKNMSFPKTERLNKKKSIEELFKKGSSFYLSPLLLKYKPHQIEGTGHRILFAVPKKKLKRAVDRNLVKRRLREAYRINKSLLHSGEQSYDIAIIYQSGEIFSFHHLEQKLITLLRRLANREAQKSRDPRPEEKPS